MEETDLKDGPLVSVCMPAYNAGRFILQSVNSVIDQSYKNWELIIVNDGSTDDTEQLLKTVANSRIRIHMQENKGQCAAANQAFSLSAGTLIKFMDADDLLSANYLEAQVKVLKDAPNAIAYSSWGRFYHDDLSSFKPDSAFKTGSMKPLDWLTASMAAGEVMLQCALWLIPRPLLKKSGLWNEQLSLINDFEFIIRVLLTAQELRYAAGSMLYYRSGLQNSLSSSVSISAAASAYNSIDWGTRYLLSQSDDPTIRKIAADCFQRFVYQFYPAHQPLVGQAEARIQELGGSAVSFPAGGYTKWLAGLLGWKMTKKIKALIAY